MIYKRITEFDLEKSTIVHSQTPLVETEIHRLVSENLGSIEGHRNLVLVGPEPQDPISNQLTVKGRPGTFVRLPLKRVAIVFS